MEQTGQDAQKGVIATCRGIHKTKGENQMKTMSGEDTIFMLEAILAVAGTEETKAQFMLDPRKASRLIMIRQLYGKDVVEQTIDKLKGVVYEQD